MTQLEELWKKMEGLVSIWDRISRDVVLRQSSAAWFAWVNARERQVSYDIAYMWHLKKNDTNELIYKTEIDSQT